VQLQEQRPLASPALRLPLLTPHPLLLQLQQRQAQLPCLRRLLLQQVLQPCLLL
jgi:hypothetical protein